MILTNQITVRGTKLDKEKTRRLKRRSHDEIFGNALKTNAAKLWRLRKPIKIKSAEFPKRCKNRLDFTKQFC